MKHKFTILCSNVNTPNVSARVPDAHIYYKNYKIPLAKCDGTL